MQRRPNVRVSPGLDTNLRHLVLGTAGHIDHGKSALVRALTGTDPDRLKEEQARGITIELGFADADLGNGRILSFVDVPGHERFVRHMVAGATGIDAVLLVVAADEGVKPQTREHLAICSLLGVSYGVVALTKLDLVDPELVEVVSLEVREFLTGSFLEKAAIVPVSSRTGAGLDPLREELRSLFTSVPERPAGGVMRLPVDRSFVLRGFGTVVTGTLMSGEIVEGAEVEILPGGAKGRVRGIQVHHQAVREARAGQRTAVNLQALACEDVPRGATVTLPGALVTTRRVWARVRFLPTAPERLRRGGPVRFHQGTCERTAKIRPLGAGPEGTLDFEIRLAEETVLFPGDRFILRRPAPVDTVGGGIVLDARPPQATARARGGVRVEAGDASETLLVRLARAGAAGRERGSLAAELGMPPADLDRLVAALAAPGRVMAASGLLFDGEEWRRAERRALEALTASHAKEPLRLGVSREELRALVCRAMPQEAWRALLLGLEQQGEVRLEAERVALASHRVVLSDTEQQMARRIEARFRDAGLDPPDARDVVSEEGGGSAARILDLLVAEGSLVRIKDGRLFHRDPLEQLRAKLRARAAHDRTIDVAAFKQLAGVTRKNAIPLLEQLDAERVTRRVGNVREIL